ncbi:MAG TPA: DoxX family protein [Chitinophagaceae bacterium]
MKMYQDIATLILRLALASGFLSAVASRLNWWGKQSSGWNHFLTYTAQVNSFAPQELIAPLAVTSTILETALGILLLAGFKTSYAAFGASALSFLFALAMSYSYGIKEPLDYSVFAFSAAALLLASMQHYRWSLDELLNTNY